MMYPIFSFFEILILQEIKIKKKKLMLFQLTYWKQLNYKHSFYDCTVASIRKHFFPPLTVFSPSSKS